MMIKHNILLTFRNFRLNKSTFFINLIGLSGGLTCCMMIFLWVTDELRVDKFHEKEARIYQVMQKKQVPGGVLVLQDSPSLLAEALASEVAEVEKSTAIMSMSMWSNSDAILSYERKPTKVNALFASKDFFNVFSFDLVQGDKDHALDTKEGVVISDEVAMRLFNTTNDLIGKTLELNNSNLRGLFKITGIVARTPSYSTLKFDVLFNYDLYIDNDGGAKNWLNANPTTFIVLTDGTDINGFNEKIEQFVQTKASDAKNMIFAAKFSDQYLYGLYENGVQVGGRINYVLLFTVIAAFILIIACINFINLSTARATSRMKEIGVKKVTGASREALMAQFISEAFVLTGMAVVISVIIVYLLLPRFNELTDKNIVLDFTPQLIMLILGVTAVTGFLSGSYPALYLSKFEPGTILKGAQHSSKSESIIRKGLVVVQYAISVILMVSVLVTYKQIDLIQSKDLGYEKDNVIAFKIEGNIKDNMSSFIASLKRIPGVVNATNMYGSIVSGFGSTSSMHWEGQSPDERIHFANQEVGYGFVETLGLKIREGRGFSEDFGNESSKVVFNETAIELMGLTDPVGKVVQYGTSPMEIIGVVKDFNFESLYEDVKPSFLRFSQEGGNILVRVNPGDERQVVEELGSVYNKYFQTDMPFEFKFLDQEYQALYNAESRVTVLSRYFAGIAIMISCLGLFGLASFTAKKRYKEIGIRKTLGCSDSGIIWLLVSDFSKVIAASIVVGLLVSYYLVDNWLDNFAYRIDLSIWYFVIVAVLTLLTAWITVSMHTIKAMKVNLAECLRFNQ